jgi:hypothetical protein
VALLSGLCARFSGLAGEGRCDRRLDRLFRQALEITRAPEKYDDSVVGEAIEVVSAFQVALRAGSVEWEGRKWNVDAMRSELVDIAKTLSSSSPDWHADTPEGAKRV